MGLTTCNGILGGREGKDNYRAGYLCLKCVFWEGGREGRKEGRKGGNGGLVMILDPLAGCGLPGLLIISTFSPETERGTDGRHTRYTQTQLLFRKLEICTKPQPTNAIQQYTSGTRLSIHVIFLQLRFRGEQLDACPHHFSFLALRRRSSMPASLATLHLPLQQLEHKMMQTVVASFFDH